MQTQNLLARYQLFVTILFTTVFSATAQERQSDADVHHLAKIEIGGQGLGFTYERRLLNKFSVDLSAGIGGGYDIAEGFIDVNYSEAAFLISVTPKYIYNRSKRAAEGKEVALNSGNYVGIRLKYVAPGSRFNDRTRNSILANIHWGVQRAIGGNWGFGFHLGAGYAQDIDYNFGTLYPAIDFRFSYALNKGKQRI